MPHSNFNVSKNVLADWKLIDMMACLRHPAVDSSSASRARRKRHLLFRTTRPQPLEEYSSTPESTSARVEVVSNRL